MQTPQRTDGSEQNSNQGPLCCEIPWALCQLTCCMTSMSYPMLSAIASILFLFLFLLCLALPEENQGLFPGCTIVKRSATDNSSAAPSSRKWLSVKILLFAREESKRIKFVASQIGPNESIKQIKRETVYVGDNRAHLLALEHAITTNSAATFIDGKFSTRHL